MVWSKAAFHLNFGTKNFDFSVVEDNQNKLSKKTICLQPVKYYTVLIFNIVTCKNHIYVNKLKFLILLNIYFHLIN